MRRLHELPPVGAAVITVILILFALAVLLLFYSYFRYRALGRKTQGGAGGDLSGFRSALMLKYSEAYQKYGQDVNTPALISDEISTRLGGLLLCERFLSHAVSLFVTLGLFGTFLGLSMSVTSLTELIGYSNSEEWLSVLDSVGGGLMSALSGMGVAFYTSLFGAGCSILLTVLRSIISPQAAREMLETRLELWLDTEVAPTLKTEAVKGDVELVKRMIDAMKESARDIKLSLGAAAMAYVDASKQTVASMTQAAESQKQAIEGFDAAIERFNTGVHDFTEVDYDLRGSVERMDLAVRDLSAALREVKRRMEG